MDNPRSNWEVQRRGQNNGKNGNNNNNDDPRDNSPSSSTSRSSRHHHPPHSDPPPPPYQRHSNMDSRAFGYGSSSGVAPNSYRALGETGVAGGTGTAGGGGGGRGNYGRRDEFGRVASRHASTAGGSPVSSHGRHRGRDGGDVGSRGSHDNSKWEDGGGIGGIGSGGGSGIGGGRGGSNYEPRHANLPSAAMNPPPPPPENRPRPGILGRSGKHSIASTHHANNANNETNRQTDNKHRGEDHGDAKRSVRFGANSSTTVPRYIDDIGTATAYASPAKSPDHRQLHESRHSNRSNSNDNSKPISKPPPPTRGNRSVCRYHSDHLWRDCPNNPTSAKFNGMNHRTMNYSSDLMAGGGGAGVRAAAGAAAGVGGLGGVGGVGGVAKCTTAKGGKDKARTPGISVANPPKGKGIAKGQIKGTAAKAGSRWDGAEKVLSPRCQGRSMLEELDKSTRTREIPRRMERSMLEGLDDADLGSGKTAKTAAAPGRNARRKVKREAAKAREEKGNADDARKRAEGSGDATTKRAAAMASREKGCGIDGHDASAETAAGKGPAKAKTRRRVPTGHGGPKRLSSLVRRSIPPSKHPPAASSSTKGAAAGSSHLFNTTDSARPIPRKMPSDGAPIGSGRIPKRSISEKGSSVVAPKKGKFRHPQNQRPPQQHLHVQARQERHCPEIAPSPADADLSENVNVHGIWRRRTRAPSGTDAIPLQKHTSTRMVRKGNQSAFGTESPEGRATTFGPGRDGNGMASSKSPGEIDESGLHDTESEDGSMSEGTVMEEDDGFSESASVGNKNPPAQKQAVELIVLDDSSDEDDAGVGEDGEGANSGIDYSPDGEDSSNEDDKDERSKEQDLEDDPLLYRSLNRRNSLQQDHYQLKPEQIKKAPEDQNIPEHGHNDTMSDDVEDDGVEDEEVNEEEENGKEENAQKIAVPVADESDQESSQVGADSGEDEQEGKAMELDNEGTAVILGEDAVAAECEKDLFYLIDHGIELHARWCRRISSKFSNLHHPEEAYHENKQQEVEPQENSGREGNEGVCTDRASDSSNMSISEADHSARHCESEMVDEEEVNDSVSGTNDGNLNGHGHDKNMPNTDDDGLPHLETELGESMDLSNEDEAANEERPNIVSNDKDGSMSTPAADRKQVSDSPTSTNELRIDPILDSIASEGNVTRKNSESASETKDGGGNSHGKNALTAHDDGLHHMESDLVESMDISDEDEAVNEERRKIVSNDKDRSMSNTAADREHGSDSSSSPNELRTDPTTVSLAHKGNVMTKNFDETDCAASQTKANPRRDLEWPEMWNLMKDEGWSLMPGSGLISWYYLDPTCAGMKKVELRRTKEEGVDYFSNIECLKQHARINLGWESDRIPKDSVRSGNTPCTDPLHDADFNIVPKSASDDPEKSSNEECPQIESSGGKSESSADVHPGTIKSKNPLTVGGEILSPLSSTMRGKESLSEVDNGTMMRSDQDIIVGQNEDANSLDNESSTAVNEADVVSADVGRTDDKVHSRNESFDKLNVDEIEPLTASAVPDKKEHGGVDKLVGNKCAQVLNDTCESAVGKENNDGIGMQIDEKDVRSVEETVNGHDSASSAPCAAVSTSQGDTAKKGSSATSSKAKTAESNKEKNKLKKEKKRQKRERRKAKKKRKLSKEGESCHDAKKQKQRAAGAGQGVDKPWTEEEQCLFHEGVEKCGGNNWGRIASDYVTSRTPLQIRQYARHSQLSNADENCNIGQSQTQGGDISHDVDKPWTEEETRLYLEGVDKCGRNNWGKIATEHVTTRTPQQVREYARCGSNLLLDQGQQQQHAESKESHILVNAEQELDSALLNDVHAAEVSIDTSNINEPKQDKDQLKPGLQDEEILSGEDSDSVSSEDVAVAAFLTCTKCDMVFMDTHEAWKHEINCNITAGQAEEEGTIFEDKLSLIKYILELNSREGKMVNEDDMVFFRPDLLAGKRPVSSDETDEDQQLDDTDDDYQQGNEASDSSGDSETEQTFVEDSHMHNNEEAEEGDDSGYAYWKDDEGETSSEDNEMNQVKHLCFTRTDPITGFPIQKLTVMCSESETLYDFQVDIKQSTIENAGHGAFLTYLGARVLKKSAAARSTRLLRGHCIENDICTHNPLEAETLSGKKVKVTLAGNNLHYNDNNIYWSKKRADKFEEFHINQNPSHSKSTHGSCRSAVESFTFDENEVKCKVHEEVKKLRQKIPDGSGIGFLGIHQESDYEPDDDELFCNHPNAFELGRYGPHRPGDRKTNLHFDFKNFVHNFEPSVWSYEVPEPMLKKRQIIDITDDHTGEVHSLAKKHTPIYVNEIGHNPELRSNVLIRDKDDRSIYYYVCITKECKMKKGDTVELFANYGDHYEQVRERKCYGRVNKSEHLGGDEDDGAKLQRNFHEREEVEKDISSLEVFAMFHLVEFLTENVFKPVNELIRSVAHGNLDLRQQRHLVARRRLHWVGEKLTGRVQEVIAHPSVDSSSECICSIRESLRQWRFVSMPTLFNKLNPDLAKILLGELSEELLYQTRSCIPNPLDETVWSNIAIDLTRKTTHSIAQHLFCSSEPIGVRKQHLGKDLLNHAKHASIALFDGSNAINNIKDQDSSNHSNKYPRIKSMDDHMNLLSFKAPGRKLKIEDLLDGTKERMISLYNSHQTIRFGTAAIMADIQAYYDAVDLCSIDQYYLPGVNKGISECDSSIVSQYEPKSANCSANHSPQFDWIARSVDAFKKGCARVNEQWYLENQVLAITHNLATTSVDWTGGPVENGWYSLRLLCKNICLDMDDAKRALARGTLKPTWPVPKVKSAYSPDLCDVSPAKESGRKRRRPRKTPGVPSDSQKHPRNAVEISN